MDLEQLEREAQLRLGAAAYDYYAGGADAEVTLIHNAAAWGRMPIRPRVLRDVGDVSTATTVLGTSVALPVLIAPMAYQRLAHHEGERATAQAAASAGTVMVVSTLATTSLEDVAAAAPDAAQWFQLYIHRDRDLTAGLVERAAAAGYRALVLTVDVPVLGRRIRDERNKFTLPDGLEMANVSKKVPEVEGSGLAAYADDAIDPAVTFADIGWLKQLCDLPVLVKGVIRGDDARQAVDAGAGGVVVSNHGGRQLDTSLATAEALLDVTEAVGGDVEVYVDGGIRRGTDIVKALALGARGVLIGRPVLWGLATGGAEGVGAVLEFFKADTERAFALCGAAGVTDIGFDLLA